MIDDGGTLSDSTAPHINPRNCIFLPEIRAHSSLCLRFHAFTLQIFEQKNTSLQRVQAARRIPKQSEM